MGNLLEIVKQAATEAVAAGEPAGVVVGTVVGTSPVSVQVDQKLTLSREFLVLTKNVMDFTVEMEVNHSTEAEEGGSGEDAFASHSHSYKGKKSFRVLNGLKSGEKVIMLKQQGGQKYVVLDRI